VPPHPVRFYKSWYDMDGSGWLRVKATIGDAPCASRAIVELPKKLFPQRARQDFSCDFVQPAGRPSTRERIEPICFDDRRRKE
jgi:hypothetical protein